MRPDTREPDVIELYVGFGWLDGTTLSLSMSPSIVDEVLELLDEHGLKHGSVLLASADYNLWVETVRVIGGAGGLAALASVIRTVIRRHDGKRVLIERPDGGKTELQGYSEESIERFLQKRVEGQKVRDTEMKRFFDDFDDGPEVE
jgi:hypothetical protein